MVFQPDDNLSGSASIAFARNIQRQRRHGWKQRARSARRSASASGSPSRRCGRPGPAACTAQKRPRPHRPCARRSAGARPFCCSCAKPALPWTRIAIIRPAIATSMRFAASSSAVAAAYSASATERSRPAFVPPGVAFRSGSDRWPRRSSTPAYLRPSSPICRSFSRRSL